MRVAVVAAGGSDRAMLGAASDTARSHQSLAPGDCVRALIGIRLGWQTDLSPFEDGLIRMSCVRAVLQVAGEHDLVVLVGCRDFAELDETIHRLRRLGADRTSTQLVLRVVPVPSKDRVCD